MSYVCDNCEKKIVSGRTGRHARGVAGKRWKKRAQVTLRTFKPNLQRVTVLIAGERRKMKLCTNCIKKFKKRRDFSRSQAFL